MQFVTHCYKTVVNNRYNDFLQKVIKEKRNVIVNVNET